MKSQFKSTLCGLALAVAGSSAVAANYELVWADEFDGASLDLTKWSYMIGDGCDINLCGWGNNERQYYKEGNVTVANGVLTIEAREERTKGSAYSSGRIRSLGKGDFTFGRIEARMKLPGTQGIWPAFWMLPSEEQYGVWAASGEIDIMEAVNLGGAGGNTVHGTLHYGGSWPNNVYTGMGFEPSTSVTENFHEYAVEWEPGEIRWYVDGALYQTQNDWYTENGAFPAPFDQDFHILLNVAVGGEWPGDPDTTTLLPQQMVVDYVRVYQDPDQTPPPATEAVAVMVSSIDASTRRVKGKEAGDVRVTVLDDQGAPVSGAVVSGTFTGSFAETLQSVTDTDGVAQFQTSTTTNSPSYDFCVDSVSNTALPYDSSLNAETCETYP